MGSYPTNYPSSSSSTGGGSAVWLFSLFHVTLLQHKYKLKYIWGMDFFLSGLAAATQQSYSKNTKQFLVGAQKD